MANDPQADALVDDLVNAVVDARLSSQLKQAETAARIVKWICDETKAPPWTVRLVYHWVLAVAVERLEKSAKNAVAAGAKKAGRRLRTIAHLPLVRDVLSGLTKLLGKAGDEQDRAARLEGFLRGQVDLRAEDINFASVGEAAALRAFEAQREMQAEAEAFQADVRELLAMLLESLQRQPPLDAKTAPYSENVRFLFRTRALPLRGRGPELERLREFLDGNESFKWWLMTGDGGAGKSRLALEFCLQVGGLWRAGFLPSEHGFGDRWHDWKPLWPTLLVVDYAAARDKEVGSMVQALALAADTFEWPVRLLLLERTKSETWWGRFTGGENNWRTHLEPTRFDAEHELAPLTDKDIWAIMSDMMNLVGYDGAADQSALLDLLRRIDPGRRPLIASFIADAVAAGKDPTKWDRRALLTNVLQRENERYWQAAGVTEADEFLLMYATMTGGQQIDVLRAPPLAEVFPAATDYDVVDRYRAFTGAVPTDRFGPLEPGMLGELFVLEKFAQAKSPLDDRAARLYRHAWDENPFAAGSICWRCTRDFGDHEKLPELFRFTPETRLQRWLWPSILFDSITALARQERFPQAVVLFDSLEGIVAEGEMFQLPGTDDPRDMLAEAAFELCSAAIRTVGDFDSARQLHGLGPDQDGAISEPSTKALNLPGELARLCRRHPDIVAVMAAGAVVDSYVSIISGKADEAAAFDELSGVLARLGDLTADGNGLRRVRTDVGADFIGHLVHAGDLATARSMFDELARLSAAFPEPPASRSRRAHAAFKLVAHYGGTGRLGDAEALYDDLLELTADRPEMAVLRGQGALAVVMACLAAGDERRAAEVARPQADVLLSRRLWDTIEAEVGPEARQLGERQVRDLLDLEVEPDDGGGESSSRLRRQAEAQFSAGDYAGAEAALSRVIESDQADGSAYRMRGSARFEQGDHDGAEADWTEAISRGAGEPIVYVWRGVARLNLGIHSEAEADLSTAIVRGQEGAGVFHQRAVARLHLGDDAGAESDCTEAIDRGRSGAEIRYLRGLARRRQDKHSLANADFTDAIDSGEGDWKTYQERGLARCALGDDAGAVSDFSAAIDRQPNQADPFLGRAEARRRQGDAAGAEADFGKAIDLGADHAAVYLQRGVLRARRGDSAGAEADLSSAIDRGTDGTDVYVLRAAARSAGDKPAEAFEDLATAMALGRDDAEVYWQRAGVHFQCGEHGAAESDCSAAIDRGKDDHEVYFRRGMCRFAQEHNAGADSDLSEAVARGQDDSEVYYWRARVRQVLGEPARAVADFTAAIRRGRDDADVYRRRGSVRLHQCCFDAAEADFAEAIARADEPNDLHYLRAITRFCRADYAGAAADHSTAIEGGAEAVHFYSGRAQARARIGKLEQAQLDCERAEALDPLSDSAQSCWGDLSLAKGDFDDALAHYRSSLQAAPGAGGQFQVGLALLLATRYAEGSEAYEIGLGEVLTEDPTTRPIEIAMALGDLDYWTKRYSDRLAAAQAQETISAIRERLAALLPGS